MANDSPNAKWWEILGYGRKAWAVAKEREERESAEQMAPLLAELKNVTAQPVVKDDTGYNSILPDTEFGIDKQIELSSALKKIGLSESELIQGDREQSQTDAIKELTRLRGAKATDQEFRNKAIQSFVDDPEADPLTAATIANKGTTFKPQRIKVRRKDGQEVYMDATPQLNGGYSYTPANDAEGTQLVVPPSPSETSPIEKDAELFERVLGMEKKSATRLSLSLRQHLKTAKPDEAWSKLVSEISKMQFNRYANNPERLYEKAAEIWQVKFPGRPIPKQAQLEESYNSDEAIENTEDDLSSGADDERSDVRQRAASEGYSIIGDWVEGKGFLVRNEQGQKGYYY